jgi:transposase, IS6 family
MVAVRLYLQYNLSYRHVEELLLERGAEVDHVTIFRWCSASRRCWLTRPGCAGTHLVTGGMSTKHMSRSAVFGGTCTRAVDQDGQVIDVLVCARRDAVAARRFFRRAMAMLKVRPTEVVTDAAPVYPAVLDELVPSAWHHVERHANNRIEADHSQLKHRLRPMRGLRTDRTAQTIIAGHAFMQNLRRGHYELGLDAPRGLRVAAAFTELATAI